MLPRIGQTSMETQDSTLHPRTQIPSRAKSTVVGHYINRESLLQANCRHRGCRAGDSALGFLAHDV